ncbi:MAG: hypothetical protein H9Q66_06500 [Spiroplasma ixodetis]|nr:hypothetical protein [Spiroplasma ixodetis]
MLFMVHGSVIIITTTTIIIIIIIVIINVIGDNFITESTLGGLNENIILFAVTWHYYFSPSER